jgi:hypothetical protein
MAIKISTIEPDKLYSDSETAPSGRIEHPDQRELLLVDKHGHHHSMAVFTNWSEAARTALGIRWIEVK